MKILMTTDTLGSSWTYSLDLCRELARGGAEPVLVTAGKTLSREQRGELRAIPGLTAFESAYRLEWMDDAWDDVDSMGRWLLEICAETQPDVVHLNQYCHANLDWQRPCVIVSHSDIFSWFHWVRGERPGERWLRYHDEVKRALAKADLVIAPSQSALNDLSREYGALPNFKLIPNGRSRHGFSESEKESFILTVGRVWDEAKNIVALDKIAQDLPAEIFAAGSCVDPVDNCEKFPKNMESLDELTPGQLATYFSRASIFALPAKYEPFGFSVLEAAMNGCALVLGDIPSLRENWDGVALFVDPNNPDQLRDTILGLLKNPDYREEFGKRARAKSAFFDVKRMAEGYLETYRSLIDSARLRAS